MNVNVTLFNFYNTERNSRYFLFVHMYFFSVLYIIWNNTDNNNNFGMAQRCLVGHPTSENKIKTRIT